jgi:hypothetical protein
MPRPKPFNSSTAWEGYKTKVSVLVCRSSSCSGICQEAFRYIIANVGNMKFLIEAPSSTASALPLFICVLIIVLKTQDDESGTRHAAIIL